MRVQLSRIFQYPSVRVIRSDGDVTTLAIDGLVCDAVCAARSGSALQKLPGVRRAGVDFERATATVEGPALSAGEYQRAIDDVVAGKGVRRVLARFARGRDIAARRPGTDA